MKLCVVLALVLLTREALGLFQGFNFGKKDGPFNLLHKHLDILGSGVDSALHLAAFMTDQHREFSKSLDNVWKNQDKIVEDVSTAESIASRVLQGTKDILNKQTQIFKGQSSIQQLINNEHRVTREQVADLQKNLQNNIDQMGNNQKSILIKIAQGRSKAGNFFEQFLKVKAQTDNQVRVLLKTVLSSQAANAKGQSRILEVVFSLRKDVADRLSALSQSQGTVLKRLASSQKNVENSIDKVIKQQAVIANAVVVSQNAELADLEELKSEQGKTQVRVKESTSAILGDISDIRNNEAGTQHILHKCKGSNCDPTKTINLIKHILKQVEEIEMEHKEHIHEILAAESKTFSEVGELEQNVLEVFSSNAAGTIHTLEDVENRLTDFLEQNEGIIGDFGREVHTLEQIQESIEHELKKLLHKLKDLHFPKGGKKKSDGFGKKFDFGKKDFDFDKKDFVKKDFSFHKKDSDFGKKSFDFP
nr:capsule protein 2 [Busycotypus canaliculatus]